MTIPKTEIAVVKVPEAVVTHHVITLKMPTVYAANLLNGAGATMYVKWYWPYLFLVVM